MSEADEKAIGKDEKRSLFENLFNVNVNDHKETKEGLSYLTWSWAWAEFKKRCPDATYEIKENPETHQHYWFDENLGYEVRTSVTVDGITYEMWLPVMDGANKAMKNTCYQYKVKNKKYQYARPNEDGVMVDGYGHVVAEYIDKTVAPATMMDINKAIMRCLVKNLAMFGLGLYIYSGEDLPESESEENGEEKSAEKEEKKATKRAIKTASEPQMNLIKKLYTEAEINSMLSRLNVGNLAETTSVQASKMIQARSVR